MFCVEADNNGTILLVQPQPVDPTVCSMVLATPAEIGSSPFALSVNDAVAIGSAIWLAWAIAWWARIAVRALDFNSTGKEE